MDVHAHFKTGGVPIKEERRHKMSVVKVIEILSESNESWEIAAQNAVTEAGKTVSNIKKIYVRNLQAVVEGNKIVKYRLNAKISFIVK